jgi:orotate phosphoribosyltransferase-like protein
MTPDLEAAAQELRTAGLSYQAIGEELGVSKKTAGRLINGADWGRGSSASSSGAGGNYRADEWSGPTEAGERTAVDYVAIILAAMAVGTLALEAFRWWRRRHPSAGDQ